MPLIKTNTNNPIRVIIHPNKEQRKNCQDVMAMLTFALSSLCIL